MLILLHHYFCPTKASYSNPKPSLQIVFYLRNWLCICRYGVRNSLLLAPMPTASTAQILGNNESIEPYTSNIYTRRVLSGEFQVRIWYHFLSVSLQKFILRRSQCHVEKVSKDTSAPSPSHPSVADEAWYWPKCVLRSGWLYTISRHVFFIGRCGSLIVHVH